MQKLKEELTVPGRPVAMLIATASFAVLFILAAGALLFTNTQRLISAGKWVEHTQDVLSALQRSSQLSERIELRTRIYLLTGEEDQLNRARISANLLETETTHIESLVADNPGQEKNAQDLRTETIELTQLLKGFSTHSPVPAVQIQQCRKTIGLMTTTEQALLVERNQGSEKNFIASIGTEIGLVVLSLLVISILSVFLVRDALNRRRIAMQLIQTNDHLEQSVQALEDRAVESGLLTAARNELQLCLDVQQVYQSCTRSFAQLLPGSSGSLCMINNSRQTLEVVSSWGDSGMEEFSLPESCCGLRSGQPRWRLPGLSEIHCTHFAGNPPSRYFCRPIAAHGNTLGVLYVQCESDEIVQAVERRMDGLRQLVQITGMAIAALNLQLKLEHQSIRDPLTDLFNRHFMQLSLDRELVRAARKNQILAVFMVDADHFKRFNDTRGHAAGDTVLQGMADVFRTSIRAEDIACRYGGEEFTIILPDTTMTGALDRAETIRRAIENLKISVGREVFSDFTVSIGVACYPHDGETGEFLLRRADLALYRAKREGRNRVSLFDGSLLGDFSNLKSAPSTASVIEIS